jgi:hypothetical protein
MRRYLAMLGMAALLALPMMAGAQTHDNQRTADAARLAELLARKGMITQQELAEVSPPVRTAPAKADQETDPINPYRRDGLLW